MACLIDCFSEVRPSLFGGVFGENQEDSNENVSPGKGGEGSSVLRGSGGDERSKIEKKVKRRNEDKTVDGDSGFCSSCSDLVRRVEVLERQIRRFRLNETPEDGTSVCARGPRSLPNVRRPDDGVSPGKEVSQRRKAGQSGRREVSDVLDEKGRGGRSGSSKSVKSVPDGGRGSGSFGSSVASFVLGGATVEKAGSVPRKRVHSNGRKRGSLHS